jgi:hypothetical protein
VPLADLGNLDAVIGAITADNHAHAIFHDHSFGLSSGFVRGETVGLNPFELPAREPAPIIDETQGNVRAIKGVLPEFGDASGEHKNRPDFDR